MGSPRGFRRDDRDGDDEDGKRGRGEEEANGNMCRRVDR